jgi:hypothetical protein
MDPKAKQARLVEAAGDELAALLAPLAPQTFVSEYWGKKPLYVKGFREKFKGFFDGAAFFRAVSTPTTAPGSQLRASFDKKTTPAPRSAAEPVDLTQHFPIPPESAGPLFEAGATLCLTEIDTRVPRLAYFAAAIKRQLGYPGPVAFNSYFSPPGVGFNWHFDGRIASTLQIEGTKRWRFSKRVAVPWPRGNAIVKTDGSARYDLDLPRAEWEAIAFDKKEITEVVLEPGDFLVLPAGTWHDASGGPTGSLALNLAFNPIAYTTIVGELLDVLLAHDAGWRSAKPLLPKLDGLPGEVDPRALESVAKQLANAAEALRSVAADSSALVALWSAFVQGGAPPIDPPSAALSAPIVASDRLRVRADGNVYVQRADGGTRLLIAVGAKRRTEVSGDVMHFAERALAARRFEAQECMAWGEEGKTLAWTEVETILTKLVNEGLLERVAK